MNNPEDSPVWQMMTAIKSTVLRTMDSVAPGIKICCIKFVQQVVQTQMSVLIADSRVWNQFNFGGN
jgi:symplekin